jgi:hypothetical protein
MRGFVTTTAGFTSVLADHLGRTGRRLIYRHFDFYTDLHTGAFRGIFLKLPLIPLSVMLERLNWDMGWGVEREPGVVKVWAGRLEGSIYLGKEAG